MNELATAAPSSFTSEETLADMDHLTEYSTTEDSDLASLGDLMYKLLTNPHIMNMTYSLETTHNTKPPTIRTSLPAALKLSEENSRVVTIVPVVSNAPHFSQPPKTSFSPSGESPGEYTEYKLPQGKLGIVKYPPFNFNVTVDSNVSNNTQTEKNCWVKESKLSQKESNILTITPVYISMTPSSSNVNKTELSMFKVNDDGESKLCNRKNKFLAFHPLDTGIKSAPQSNNAKIIPRGRNIPHDYLKRNSSKKNNFPKHPVDATTVVLNNYSSTVNIREELKLLSMMCELLTGSPASAPVPPQSPDKPNTHALNNATTTEKVTSSSISTQPGISEENAPPPGDESSTFSDESKSIQNSESASKEVEDITGPTSSQGNVDSVLNTSTVEITSSTVQKTSLTSSSKAAVNAPKLSHLTYDSSSPAISKNVFKKGKGDMPITGKFGNIHTSRFTAHQSVFRSICKCGHMRSTSYTSAIPKSTTPQFESEWISSPSIRNVHITDDIKMTSSPQQAEKSKLSQPVVVTDQNLINWMCKLMPNASICETLPGLATQHYKRTPTKILEKEELTESHSCQTTHAPKVSKQFRSMKYQPAVKKVTNMTDEKEKTALTMGPVNFATTICTPNATGNLRLIYLMCDVIPNSTEFNNFNSYLGDLKNNILETSTFGSRYSEDVGKFMGEVSRKVTLADGDETIVEASSTSGTDDTESRTWDTSNNERITDATRHEDTTVESLRKNLNEESCVDNGIIQSEIKRARRKRKKEAGNAQNKAVRGENFIFPK